jgi:uncharacterized protein (TIGR03086 family)
VSDQDDLLASVLEKTGALIAGARPEQEHDSTPCSGFDVRGLVDHLVEWLTKFATSAAGSEPPPIAEHPSSWPDGPAERFSVVGVHAVEAFRNGAVERPLAITGGEVPGRIVVGMMLMEYIGHGWDLATATGQDVPFTDEEAEAALAVGRQMLKPEFRGPDKPFGHEVPVGPDAGSLEQLIGFLGRGAAPAGAS